MTNEIVKSVAKQLKYYFEVKRLEDGFDLSDVHQPQLDHPPLKVRPALQNDGLHDRALKHYFSQPEVKVQLTQMNNPSGRVAIYGRKELQVRQMLETYMHHYNFQRNPLPSCYNLSSSRGCSARPQSSRMLSRSKRNRNLIGGWPILRTVPDQHITKGEASRLINSATKILVAAAYDDSYVEKQRSNTPEVRPRSPTPSQSTITTTTTSSTVPEEKPVTRPRSAKYRSRTIINVAETRPQEEVAVIRSTQTTADYDVGSQTDRKHLEKHDFVEEEVQDGPWCKYHVYVCTGNRIGASTKAAVKITIYGEKGRTKEFTLTDSERHKIPFQKGKEDLFLLPAHHVGRMKRIKVGHDRPELSYAWYCEGITIYDMSERRIFQFPCERWLSGQDGDQRTYRTLEVDRERAFLDVLDDEEPSNVPEKHVYTSESEAFRKDDLAYKRKSDAVFITRAIQGDVSETDSDSSSGSSISSSSNASSKVEFKPKNADTPREEKTKENTKVKDDFEEKAKTGPVITLHTVTNSQQVDEIYMDPRGKDAKPKPAGEYLAGYKAALSASEIENKKRLEREREIERSLLQGKSIHEAVRDGDLDQVKDLLHHFPEMRDYRDESSWTPLHLAAARGNIDLLRWLVTSDADINLETSTGYNAMHIAAMNGHVNSMMLLQAMGSSIMGLTAEKQSALHLASKSGHLECVKWLVANRAQIQGKDNFGRAPMELAEQFGHDACADFLRVCINELSNPRSTFAQMHGRHLSSNLPPIEEDAASASSGSPWRDNTVVKGHSVSESEDEGDPPDKKRTEAEKYVLEQKHKMYNEQQQIMQERELSFLDSIRQEVDS